MTKMLNPDGSVMVSRNYPEFGSLAKEFGGSLAKELEGKELRGRCPTSGEWFRIAELAKEHNPELWRDIITGPYEITATTIDLDPNPPILYQHPHHNGTNLLDHLTENEIRTATVAPPDSGLVAEDKREMEVPELREIALVRSLPQRYNQFIDALYGKRGARDNIDQYASIVMFSNHLITILVGGGGGVSPPGGLGRPEYRATRIDGKWGPFIRAGNVSSRVVMDELV